MIHGNGKWEGRGESLARLKICLDVLIKLNMHMCGDKIQIFVGGDKVNNLDLLKVWQAIIELIRNGLVKVVIGKLLIKLEGVIK